MDRLKLIDDVRLKALSMMKEDSSLTYEAASRDAKIQITGEDALITKYHQEEEQISFLELAKQELSSEIRVDLYQDEQLKEMIVANRLGVHLEDFINIFLSPEQIRFLTLVSLRGEDVEKYISDLHFNPDEEMKKLLGEESTTEKDASHQKQYTLGTLEAA